MKQRANAPSGFAGLNTAARTAHSGRFLRFTMQSCGENRLREATAILSSRTGLSISARAMETFTRLTKHRKRKRGHIRRAVLLTRHPPSPMASSTPPPAMETSTHSETQRRLQTRLLRLRAQPESSRMITPLSTPIETHKQRNPSCVSTMALSCRCCNPPTNGMRWNFQTANAVGWIPSPSENLKRQTACCLTPTSAESDGRCNSLKAQNIRAGAPMANSSQC